MQPFDVLHCTLDGAKLVEASAGTGKTFAIAALYLRLVLERGLRPPQVLVVTYTEAATKELRDRIRTRLREAHQAFLEPDTPGPDEVVQELVARTPDRPQAIRRLSRALSDFDQAAVFTIHGFCQRTLQENAFESGNLFDTELVTEQDDLKLEIVEDFWRRHFYQAPPVLVHRALEQGYSPVVLMDLVKTSAIQPDLRVLPELGPQPWEEVERCLEGISSAIGSLRQQWPQVCGEVASLLRSSALNATMYGAFKPGARGDGSTVRDEKIDRLLEDLERYLDLFDPAYPLPLPEKFELLTAAKLQKATKAKEITPVHAVFDLADAIFASARQLLAAVDAHLLYLKTELFRTLQEELPARKHRKNVQHFDDLLLKLREALDQPGGAALAAGVRGRYDAALIDEFQDTDPIQYDIFRKLFAIPGRSLFLIGDPKQAIYSFRGADVFAYLEAARDIPERFTLGTNWRSEPALIRAVNTIFESRPDPFVFPEIAFQAVAPPKDKVPQPLSLSEQPFEPLRIWHVGSAAAAAGGPGAVGGKTPARVSKGAARLLILAALGQEIARLLRLGAEGRARVGDRPLQESDLAVLLRTNREAGDVKDVLTSLGIPAVLYSTDNVFDSREALEMERLLQAVAAPHDERLLRAALATDMLGVKGDELMGLAADASNWERWLLSFRDYAQLWAEQGFIRMFRQLMVEREVRARLVAFPDGERRLTNTLHLAEILQEAAVHQQLGMADLIRWFAEQRNPDTRTVGEQQLRLESDDNAVRLVTIHKSKGLEYPVVFCPFLWHGSKDARGDRPLLFHDATEARRLTLDLGSPSPEHERHQALAAREALAENLRLLYVALTRARQHCTLVWGWFNQADTAAAAYLLHHPGESSSPELVEEMEAGFKSLDDAAVLERLREVAGQSEGTIGVSELPVEVEAGYSPRQTEPASLTARTFQGAIERHWRVSSFSALTSHQPREGEWPDRDEADAVAGPACVGEGAAPADAPVAPADIFAFPKGARPGTLLHDILEHLDFATHEPEGMQALVAQKLQDYGFDLEWREAVCAMLARLLRVPLGSSEKPFTLADISNQDRLNELEFYIPLRHLTPERLREAFAAGAGARDAEGLDAERGGRGDAGTEKHGDAERWRGGHGGATRATVSSEGEVWGSSEILSLSPGSWDAWLDQLRLLDFTPVHGFLRGFMDLVFHCGGRYYLVDWKSNHLGHSIGDYGPHRLAEAMVREAYLLQYHLYVVALDRYLAVRLPDYRYDDHFGGVYYIFLRGLDPDAGPNYGIFRDRPPQSLVEALGTTLWGERP